MVATGARHRRRGCATTSQPLAEGSSCASTRSRSASASVSGPCAASLPAAHPLRGEAVVVAGVAVGGEELRPLGFAAEEGVAVDVAVDAGDAAGRRVLPHDPLAVLVALVRLGGDATHPVRVFGELALEHLLVEGDVGVDDRALAGMR